MTEPVVAAYFLDVGQGDCSFVIPPDEGEVVLCDCADAFVAERFVKDHGIRHLGSVVVSHLDRDHVGGMLRFLKNFLESGSTVRKVYVEIDRWLNRSGLSKAKALLLGQLLRWEAEGVLELSSASRERSHPKVLCHGRQWSVELVLPFFSDVLAMEGASGKVPNACSAVLHLVCGENAALIGADAPLSAWEHLESDRLPANVFRIPHHGGLLDEGSPDWTLPDLYQRVAADTCFISVGTRNPHGHPLPEHVRASLRGGKSRVLCTQITARCHGDPLAHRERALERASAIVYPYRHRVGDGSDRDRRRPRESPCAGSAMLVLYPSSAPVFDPAPNDWHDAHVSLMDQPLCRHFSRPEE